MKKRYYIDTEFHEDGRIIDPISIGIACEDGRAFYVECKEFDESVCNDFVKQNVLPYLTWDREARMSRERIRQEVELFIGKDDPEFWGYFADTDWVVFYQLWGRMVDMPPKWPNLCLDVRQYTYTRGIKTPKLSHFIPDGGVQHNALADAVATMSMHEYARSLEG